MTPPLPVPSLESTVERACEATQAVAPEHAPRTKQRAQAFLEGEGPALQAALEAFAAKEAAEGRSWLSSNWLSGYLTVRTPLPTTTNVSFQLNPALLAPAATSESHGEHPDEPVSSAEAQLARTVGFILRAATVHLAEVRGETEQETNARGTAMDMAQWSTLAGGLRHPQAGEDAFLRAWSSDQTQGDGYEVGIFTAGRLYPLAVADREGQLRSAQSIAAELRAIARDAGIVASSAALAEGKNAQAASQPDPRPWYAASFLGSAALAAPLEAALQDPENAATYDRLARMPFTVSLLSEAEQQRFSTDAAQLTQSAFQPGRCWAYKPLSYELGLGSDWLCVHVEHSTIDGATLVAALSRMQQVEPDTAGIMAGVQGLAGTEDQHEVGEHGVGQHEAKDQQAAPAPLPFEFSEALPVAKAARQAERFRVDLVTVPRRIPAELPFKLSLDAAQQLILSIAQRLAFGRIRSVYEAVDMREYQAGRTECLRPVTPAAVRFAEAVVEGSPDPQLLREALEAHRSWVKWCKQGCGIDRHLLGLSLMARRHDRTPEFLTDEGLAAVREDFLSTTSLGSDAQILRYAFAPTQPEGFGVTYTPTAEGFEFCISSDTSKANTKAFIEQLDAAATLFWDAVEAAAAA